MNVSRLGERLGGPTGIMELMDDMGRALLSPGTSYMLGGGNPARIPGVEALWRQQMERLMADSDAVERMLGTYDTPQGQPAFIEALAQRLNREFDWKIGPEHIAISNGSQTAFFLLLNMLAGTDNEGRRGRILLPLLPEYIGYADQGLEPDLFVACRPRVEQIDEHAHKYHVDFDAVERELGAASGAGAERIAAMCVSRPTNPSGNVLTDHELARLDELAQRYGVPLVVDNAYGMPFPHIIFDEQVEGSARPMWNDNTILLMSLSKIGLPGTRTGIVVGRPEIVRMLSRANAVVSLANTTVGQILVEPLLRSGELLQVAQQVIRPFYKKKAEQALAWVHGAMGESVPYSLHRVEGSIFLWLWLPRLPITTKKLYNVLKKRGLIVVPGEYFFYGDPSLNDWDHTTQCLRLNYGQNEQTVQSGIGILAEEVRRLWA